MNARDISFPLNARYEIKLVARPEAYATIRSIITAHPSGFITAYPPRRVNNVYFDTYELASLEQHLSGVNLRSKLRFRWYGSSWEEVQGSLEKKIKRDKVNWKVISYISETTDFTTMTWQEIRDIIRRSITGELLFDFDIRCCPLFINYYQREYFVSPTQNVRITLDYDHVAFEQWSSSRPRLNAPSNLQDILVIEIKSESDNYKFLREVLSEFPLRPSKHSKFLNCVNTMIT